MQLSDLKNGEYGIVSKVRGKGAFRKRIIEMGFIRGKKVTVVKNAPLKDPIEYSVMGYEVSLRRAEASLIEVVTPDEAKDLLRSSYTGVHSTISEEELVESGAKVGSKIVNVALVGNPNSGKTTLFNWASGSREHVGNYSGVTVDSKQARFKHKGYTFIITDLPGTYSLTAYTPEELYVRRYIHESKPDVVINVVDSSNLERNLYLTTQLIDMDIKVVVALNMFDELTRHGDRFQYKELGQMLGIPFVPTVSSRGKGIDSLFDTIINVYADKDKTLRHVHINYGEHIERAIDSIQRVINAPGNELIATHYSTRFLSIKLLEKDKQAHSILKKTINYPKIKEITDEHIPKLEGIYNEDSETLLTDAKYGFIAGALKETYREGAQKKRQNTETIDAFMTHKLFGFPIFLLFMWITFFTTFRLGAYPMEWIEMGVGYISSILASAMPEGAFKDLLIGGILNGVGSVIVFLPNILILFFFISLLEDTGYMARAVFILDKLMHRIGLHGKSFIPLIMGFGCNVPAIMATRTIENRNNRMVTMLINPFMSCSARLPVYILILGALFPTHAGTLLFVIYLIGIGVALVMAVIFKNTLFKGDDVPFVMELPPYRIPTFRSTMRHMWGKGSQYIKKMGGVILVAVVLVWALGYYPHSSELVALYEERIDSTKAEYSSRLQAIANTDSAAIVSLEAELVSSIKTLNDELSAELQRQSYLGQIGQLIEPIIRPLGFDWKIGVSLLSGVAAKEIVVSTLAVLMQSSDEVEGGDLIHKLRAETHTIGPRKGQPVFTPLSSLSFIIFILLYFPCVAVIAAIKKESGSWKWAAFTVFYTTGLAYLMALLVYQVGSLFV